MKAEDLIAGYARAVYEKALERWVKSLEGLQETLRANPAMAEELENPDIPFAKKKEVLDMAMLEETDVEVYNFAYLLAREGHIELLGDVVDHLLHMVKHGPAVTRAEVKTSMPLADDQKAAFVRKLQATYGVDLYVDFVVDPGILGGVVVQVGDKIIDGSIAGRLESIKERIGG